MYADQCISITELRRKTGQYIGNPKQREQFIFVGSKPTNVLMSMERYEELKRMEESLYEAELDLHFVPYSELSVEEQSRYDEAKKEPVSSYIDF